MDQNCLTEKPAESAFPFCSRPGHHLGRTTKKNQKALPSSAQGKLVKRPLTPGAAGAGKAHFRPQKAGPSR